MSPRFCWLSLLTVSMVLTTGSFVPVVARTNGTPLGISKADGNLLTQGDTEHSSAREYFEQSRQALKEENYELASELAKQALNLLQQSEDEESQVLAARALYVIGFSAYKQEEYSTALDSFRDALVIYREVDNQLGQADMLWKIAKIYDTQQDHEQSRENYQLSVELYRALGKQGSIGNGLNRIGLTYFREENYEAALELFQKALVVYREGQYKTREITVLGNIADAYKRQKLFEQSLEFYQQALELARKLDNEQQQAKVELYILNTYLDQSQYELEQDNYDLALDSAVNALELARKLGNLGKQYWAFRQLNYVLIAQGYAYSDNEMFDDSVVSFELALDAAQKSLDTAKAMRNSNYEARALAQLLLSHSGLSDTFLEYGYDFLQKREFDLSRDKSLLAIESIKRAIGFGQDALFIAKQLDDEWLLQHIYELLITAYSDHRHGHVRIAYVYSAQRNFEEELISRQNALAAVQVGLSMAIESDNPRLIAKSSSDIASAYDNISTSLEILGLYQESLEAARFALEFSKPTNARKQILSALRSLASNYNDLNESLLEQGDYIRALANAKQRLTYAEHLLKLAEKEIQSDNEPFIEDIGKWAFVTSEEERSKWVRRALRELWLTYQDFAWIFYEQNEFSESIKYSHKALAVAERLEDPELEHAPLIKIVMSYEKLGEYEQALKTELAILDLAERTNDLSKNISAYIGLGYIHSTLGRYPEAADAYQNAIRIAQSENIKSQEATALNNLAIVYQQQGNYLAALDIYNQNLDVVRQLRVKIELAGATENFREFCFLSAFNEAQTITPEDIKVENSGILESLHEETLELQRQRCIEDTWSSEHTSINNIAVIYAQQGLYHEALELHHEALEISVEFEDENDRATSLGNIGSVYLNQGAYQDAEQAFKESLSIHRKLVNNLEITKALNNLATIYSYQGQYEKAQELFQEALKIAQELDFKPLEPIATGNIGSMHSTRGEYESSQQYFEQSLAIAEELGIVSIQATQLKHLGVLFADLGNYSEALNYLEKSLNIYQETGVRPLESAVLLDISQVKQYQGDFAKALLFQEQALDIMQDIDDVDGTAGAFTSLGATYTRLGQYNQATNFFQKALVTFTDIGNISEKASVLNHMGNVAERQNNYEEALTFYEQALAIYQQIGDVKGETTSLMNIGFIQNKLKKLSDADQAFQTALDIQRDVQARAQEGEILRGLALIRQEQNDSEQAVKLFQQSLALHRELGDRSGEAQTLSDLGKLYAQQDRPELATVFLKQAVNTYEVIRKENRILDQDLQSSYTDTVADTYRQLADVLLTQGRIPEAQQVLDLLKVEEIREYTSRAVLTSDGIQYSPLEQPVIDTHGDLIAFGQALSDCKQKNGDCKELLDQKLQLNKEYVTLVNSLQTTVLENRGVDEVFQNPDNLGSNAKELLAANPNSVLIYPLVTDTKLWLVYTSQDVVASIGIDVTQKDLAETVQLLGEQLQSGGNLPALQATSQTLYNWLIQPLDDILQKHEVQHIIFANDRVTRYIPMAALYDGEKYLVEHYALSSVLSAELTDTTSRLGTVNDSTVLGLGVTQATAGFDPLPAVNQELDAIVQSNDQDLQGIYPGQVYLNNEFTLEQLKANVLNSRILHVATHAEFIPGNPRESYILLGDGNPLTGQDIDILSEDYLSNLHLVVLSACQTALGGPDSDGAEIAGMSSYFLEQGRAESVLASLWAVNDSSTSLLMQNFYVFMASGKFTKAEALREAQLSLLYDQDVETRLEATRATVNVASADGRALVSNTSIAHPYHWAPFIMIGNAL
ncbi:MAG: tetratricopeptide repeat protein [Cyanobacteria bacterium P01_A01_bin.137]